MNNAEDYYKKARQKDAATRLLKGRGPNNSTATKLKAKINENSSLEPTIEENKNDDAVDAQANEDQANITTAKSNKVLGKHQITNLQTDNQPNSAVLVSGVFSPPEKVGNLKMKLTQA